MAQAASLALREFMDILNDQDAGFRQTLADLVRGTLGPTATIPEVQIAVRNIAPETAEKSGDSSYPLLLVYCERMTNDLREKFRTFAGTVSLAADVRVTSDHAFGLDGLLHVYVEAVTEVLDRARGTWREGLYYPGGYEVTYAPTKRGGKNFLQTAKIRLDVIVSQ